MYKITNITDRDGNVKYDFINKLKEKHPELLGEFLDGEIIQGVGLYFLWADNTGRMLRTSTVCNYIENEDRVIVTTRNSVYTFEEVE